MKNIKRTLPPFAFYERANIETYLEKQAADGWMIDKIGMLFWRFRRIEPQQLKFSVVYYEKASAYDPNPSEEELSFREFCEHTGWQLAATNVQMHVFYNETATPVPIETDAVLAVESIHKVAKKNHLLIYFVIMGTFIFSTAIPAWITFHNPLDFWTDIYEQLAYLQKLIFLIYCGGEILFYCHWHKRAKQVAALDGTLLPTNSRSHKCFTRALLVLICLIGFFFSGIFFSKAALIVLAISICMIIATIIPLLIKKYLKKKGVSAHINRTITIVLSIVLYFVLSHLMIGAIITWIFMAPLQTNAAKTYEYDGKTYEIYHDELPLTVEDLIKTNYQDYSYEITSHDISPFMERLCATQETRMGVEGYLELEYTVTTVKIPFLYETGKRAVFKEATQFFEENEFIQNEYIEIEAAPWGANQAFQEYYNGKPLHNYLLYYDSCFVEISFISDDSPTPAQMQIVGKKLGQPI